MATQMGPCPAKGQPVTSVVNLINLLGCAYPKQPQQSKMHSKKFRIQKVSTQESDKPSSSSDDEYLYTLKQGANRTSTGQWSYC